MKPLVTTSLLCLFLILLSGSEVRAQNSLDTIKVLNDATAPKKRFWRASGELLLVQLIPWSFNYFIRDADFAHISFASIGHNLQFKNWEFDDNKFTTNQFAHPYEGNLYFNSFRTNGYNFWQSAPAAFAGSYMWEVAGETNPPAPNDFINTSFGGISLGEMTYRVSNRIINKKQRGFKRQLNEIAAMLIDPLNGFNRILDGQWGKVSNTVTDLDTISLGGELELGFRRIGEKDGTIDEKGKTGWYARVRLLYGDPFEESKKPFNNFDVVVELGDDDSTKLNVVRVNGFLTSWELEANERVDHLLALTLNYDFYNNASFEYGAQSVGLTLNSKFTPSKKTTILTRVGVGGVILAAVPDAYLYYGEGRNYDYGPGFTLTGAAGLLFANRLTWLNTYRGGWFTTINGNSSNHFLHTVSSELRVRLIQNISLGAEAGYFILHGNYRDYPDVNQKYPFGRLSLGIKI